MKKINNCENMSKEEIKCKINAIYEELIAKGIIRNKQDFAELVDYNYNGLTQAMNGVERYVTESLLNKVRFAKTNALRELEQGKAMVAYTNDDSLPSEQSSAPSALAPVSRSVKMVPTIPIHAYHAYNFDVMEYFRSTSDEVRMSPIVLQFPGTDCYYFVNSEDMSPHLRTNDLLCLARIPDGAKVTNGDICVVNTMHQGLLERFVYDEGDSLLLKSSQPRWTDMLIPKDEVFSIFRILGGIRTNI